MLSKVIEWSLKNSSAVLVAAGVLVFYAGVRLNDIPVDVFPELNAPTVVILSESPGLSSEEVETGVTFPIETSLGGLTGVRRVRSASTQGLSLVWAEFDWGADIYRARQLVSERLNAVREVLPSGVHAEITPITSITGEILLLSLSSPSHEVSDLEVRSIAEFRLRPELMAIPGIAQVTAIGGSLPELRVAIDGAALEAEDLDFATIADAAAQSTAIRAGGYLEDVDRQELPVRQMARALSVRDIAETRLPGSASVARLGDLAEISIAAAPRRGTAADGGRPAVVLSVQKSPGMNTLALTGEVDRVLDAFEKTLPAGVELNRRVFRQSDFIQRSLDNVTSVLRDAVIIVAVILILFLMNFRTTLITLIALPLSVAAAVLILAWQGLTMNVMTLGGLAVAVGELVDDAIIDVENVYRRLRENAALPEINRRPHVAVILDASNEIRSAVVFATILIVIVFAPLMFLEGLEGRFFRPLALTYVTSILASLVIALTVTPALCRFLLRVSGGHSNHGDSRFAGWIKRRYEPLLDWSIRHGKMVLTLSAGLMVIALFVLSTFGTSFLPEFNEGTFTVFLNSPPGTSLSESDRVARGVEARLVAIPGVSSVTRRTGRAERDEHAEPPSSSEIEVTVHPDVSKDAVRRLLDDILAQVPGLTTSVGQPIEHRLSHILSGAPAAIAISVYSEDLSRLRRLAQDIATELKTIPGARDVNAAREMMVTTLPIQYRREDLRHAGLTPSTAAQQVEDLVWGRNVGVLQEAHRRMDVTVRLDQVDRESIADLRQLVLRNEEGARVRLHEVADVEPVRAPNIISRENARRKALITLNVAEGANLGDLVEDVRQRVDPLVAAAGASVAYGGQFEARTSARRTLLLGGLVILGVMFLLLANSTGSWRAALLVLLNLPLSLIGGVAAVFVVESPDLVQNLRGLIGLSSYQPPVVSIATMIGFMTLFGIAVRNGILLVNHFVHLIHQEGAHLDEAVRRGSMERLVPILMTALSAALGLYPLAMARGEPGAELLAPLALVVLGGLLSSTILNLFVIPAGYRLFVREGVCSHDS